MFTEILKKLREERGVSRYRMCKDLKLSTPSMLYAERFGGSYERQKLIADYFGKPMEEVFPGKTNFRSLPKK